MLKEDKDPNYKVLDIYIEDLDIEKIS